MFCKKCGSPLPDGSRFCTLCGADQSASTQMSELSPGSPPPSVKKNRGHGLTALIVMLTVLLAGALGMLVYSLFLQEPVEASASHTAASRQDGPEAGLTEPFEDPTASTSPSVEETDDTNPPPTAADHARSILDGMSTEELIYQLFIVTPESLTDTDAVEASSPELTDALASMPVGGVILAERNILTPEQCTGLINAMQSAARTPMFMAVNEEGGSYTEISHNSAMGIAQIPLAGDMGDTQTAYDHYLGLGTSIHALGFNLDLAPVADVNSDPGNILMGKRAFGSDPETAAQMLVSAAKGLSDGNVIPCLKHYPGHGDVEMGTYAHCGKTLDELKETELIPFMAGIEAGVPMIMAGYIVCPNVTGDDLPAPLSQKLIGQLLRTELGFDGIVMTDVLLREDVTRMFPDGQAAILALQAGCDLLLMPDDPQSTMKAILAALESGDLEMARLEESVLRVLRLKIEYGIIPADMT